MFYLVDAIQWNASCTKPYFRLNHLKFMACVCVCVCVRACVSVCVCVCVCVLCSGEGGESNEAGRVTLCVVTC